MRGGEERRRVRTKPKAREVCQRRKRQVARAGQPQGCLCACPRPLRGGLRKKQRDERFRSRSPDSMVARAQAAPSHAPPSPGRSAERAWLATAASLRAAGGVVPFVLGRGALEGPKGCSPHRSFSGRPGLGDRGACFTSQPPPAKAVVPAPATAASTPRVVCCCFCPARVRYEALRTTMHGPNRGGIESRSERARRKLLEPPLHFLSRPSHALVCLACLTRRPLSLSPSSRICVRGPQYSAWHKYVSPWWAA